MTSIGMTSVPIGHPFDSGDAIEPVFIIGSGRSGTTLLRRMLMEGGQLHIPPESYVLGPLIQRYAVWRYLPWSAVVERVLTEFESHPEFVHFDVSLRPLRRPLSSLPAGGRSLSAVLDPIYRYHSEQQGAGALRWGDKTPLNTRYLPEIARVFPAGKFVHMLRDGCDVVFSLLEMGRYGTVEAAALRWRSAVAASREFSARHPEAVLEIRYEELVEHPEDSMRRLCAWLGVDYVPAMLGPASMETSGGDIGALPHHRKALGRVEGSSVGRGRNGLDAESRRELQRLIGPTLASVGYPPATA